MLKGTEGQIQYATDLLNKFNAICKNAEELLAKGEAQEDEIEELKELIEKINNKKISDKAGEIIFALKEIDDDVRVIEKGIKMNIEEINVDEFEDIDEAYELGKEIQFQLENFLRK